MSCNCTYLQYSRNCSLIMLHKTCISGYFVVQTCFFYRLHFINQNENDNVYRFITFFGVFPDTEKRRIYDQHGEQGIKEGGGGGGNFHSPMDLFDMFFGGGGGGFGGHRHRGPRRTKNLMHPLNVSLEELHNGATRKLALQKNVICASCEGLGGKEGAVQKCPTCRGSGMQIRIQQLGPGMMQQIQSVCSDCQGQGERIDPKHRCKSCNGKKVI